MNACTLYIRFQKKPCKRNLQKKVSSHKKLQTKVQKNSFLLIVYRIIERGFNLLYYNQIGLCAAIVFNIFLRALPLATPDVLSQDFVCLYQQTTVSVLNPPFDMD